MTVKPLKNNVGNELLLLMPLLLGALHAFEPGHGKSVMAVFMGTDGTVKDATLLGLLPWSSPM